MALTFSRRSQTYVLLEFLPFRLFAARTAFLQFISFVCVCVPQIAKFALEAVMAAKQIPVREEDPSETVLIRVGFHSGPVRYQQIMQCF